MVLEVIPYTNFGFTSKYNVQNVHSLCLAISNHTKAVRGFPIVANDYRKTLIIDF